MHLHRVVINWTGAQIRGAAVTVLHFDGSSSTAPPSAAAIGGAFGPFMGQFPTGVSVTFPGVGDTIEDTTGALVGTWSTGHPVTTVGGGVAKAAAGAGAVVTWNTGGIVAGRRLRGRTFLVPLCTDAYDLDGSLSSGTFTALNNFGTALMAVGPLAVWHRPTTPGGSDGTSYGVTSFRARDKVAFLSSRRD